MSLTTFWNNSANAAAVSVNSLTAAQLVATTTPSVFNSWSLSAQLAFVKANGTGTPTALLIGPYGNQELATLNANASSLTQSLVPSTFGTAPVDMDYQTFTSWSPDLQSYYIQNHGMDAQDSLSLGYNTTQFTAKLSTDGTSVTLTPSTALQATLNAAETTSSNLDPDQMDAATFFTMTAADQLKYVQTNDAKYASETVPTVGLLNQNNTSGGLTIPLKVNGTSFAIIVPASTYGISSLTASATSDLFSSWPAELQTAYMSANGGSSYPKTILLSPPGTTANPNPDPVQVALQSSAGGTVDLEALPSGFLDYYNGTTLPPADVFMTWNKASQIAFVKAHGTSNGTALTLGDLKIKVNSSSSQPITFSANTRTSGAPNTIDPSVFGLWSSADQQTFFNANSSGTPPSVTIGSGTYQTLLTSVGGQLVVQPYPADFSTSPGDLLATTFLQWNTDFRTLYLQAHGTGPTFQTTIGGQITASIGSDSSIAVAASQFAVTAGLNANTLPYNYLPGSAVGTTSTVNQSTATSLFPNYDGSSTATTSTPLPDGFTTDPASLSPSLFGTWTSSQQIHYIGQHLGGKTYVEIGANTGTTVQAFVSAPTTPQVTNPKVYVVQSLQKQDIAKMALTDQITLTGIPGWLDVASSLGLIPSSDTSVSAGTLGQAQGIVNTLFQTAISHITAGTVFNSSPPIATYMPAADVKVFTDEINLLQSQLSGSAIFSTKDIQDKITAITTRFDRANAFAADLFTAGNRSPDGSYTYLSAIPAPIGLAAITLPVTAVPPDPNGALPADGSTVTQTVTQAGTTYSVTYVYRQNAGTPASLDGNNSIRSGYQTFMTQEQTILDLANRANQLAQTGIQAGTQQNLDVPNLIFLFQLYTNLTGEAVVRADTEEVNQTNQLLQMYSAMQAIINQTVGAFGTASDQQRPLQGSSGVKDGNGNTYLTDQEIATVKLFSTSYGTPVRNPIEILKNMQRSTSDTGKYFTPAEVGHSADPSKGNTSNGSETDNLSTHWNQVGTSLSDAVTLINQDSQLKMNDINSETKQKDRNFDLANNALSKMSDIIQQIGNTIN